MLPLYGLAVVADKQADPASFVAMTIVIAQGVMILTSLAAMRMAEKEGYWLVLLVSFVALPIRGVIAAWLLNKWGVYPVQIPEPQIVSKQVMDAIERRVAKTPELTDLPLLQPDDGRA